jgi:hypothetical protein
MAEPPISVNELQRMDLDPMGAETLTGKTCGSVQFLRFCSGRSNSLCHLIAFCPRLESPTAEQEIHK